MNQHRSSQQSTPYSTCGPAGWRRSRPGPIRTSCTRTTTPDEPNGMSPEAAALLDRIRARRVTEPTPPPLSRRQSRLIVGIIGDAR
ncbi:hypothetical protein [Gordonia sp. NPDC003585]|uniref:hypothetical protein n=1 Tax=Gordonia sp. NPDC003585 TaxID=3154275 RepID=UPI0033BDEE08